MEANELLRECRAIFADDLADTGKFSDKDTFDLLARIDAHLAQPEAQRQYSPEELHEVAINTFVPKDFYKNQALGDLISALERPDGWKPEDQRESAAEPLAKSITPGDPDVVNGTDKPGNAGITRQSDSHPVAAQPTEPVLDEPAQIGGTIFSKGIKHSTVIDRAKREYGYMQQPEMEAERMGKARKSMESLAVAAQPEAMPDGYLDVVAERERQISKEGWTLEHDDEHDGGTLACAGAAYALQAGCQLSPYDGIGFEDGPPDFWPQDWRKEWWKPKGPRRDLVRAAALIIAEIERLDRVTALRAAT